MVSSATVVVVAAVGVEVVLRLVVVLLLLLVLVLAVLMGAEESCGTYPAPPYCSHSTLCLGASLKATRRWS